jgi:HEAT repeat protein
MMRGFFPGALSGTIVGIGLGLWLGSSTLLSFTEREYDSHGEAVYQGRPASFWLRQLEDADQVYRQQAVQALESIGVRDQRAVPALGETLKDPSALVRLGATIALRDLGPLARPAIPALLTALQDHDRYVRTNAVAALGGFCSADPAVLPGLAKALKDPSPMVREMAAKAIQGQGLDQVLKEVKRAAIARIDAED